MEQIYLFDYTKHKLDKVCREISNDGNPVTYDEAINYLYDQAIHNEDLEDMEKQQ